MIRIVSALVLAACALAAVWFLPQILFNVLMVAIAGAGLAEFSGLFFDDPVEIAATVIAGLIVTIAMLTGGSLEQAGSLTLCVSLFILAVIFMWRAEEIKGAVLRLSLASFGLVYLGVSFSFWGLLRGLDHGREWVLLALFAACLTDTFGLMVGKLCGKHPFAPIVSPKKTWEGFAGALVGSLIGTGGVWFFSFRDQFLFWHTLCLGVMIWCVAPLGDLVESMLKRSVGVKDSGNVIPGHGGILDRVDALVFTAPFVYLYVTRVIGI